MKKFAEKNPLLFGLVSGYGLLFIFLFVGFLNVKLFDSEWVYRLDIILRFVFFIPAAALMKILYGGKIRGIIFGGSFRKACLFALPLAVYWLTQPLYLIGAVSLALPSVAYVVPSVLQQIGTGLFEEGVCRGLAMGGLPERWLETAKGRLLTAAIGGIPFGLIHIMNVVYGSDLYSALWNALYAGIWGLVIAVIYMYSGSLFACMAAHTLHDIIVRLPEYFISEYGDGILVTAASVSGDIMYFAVFPIFVILVCVKFKPVKNLNRS